MSEEETFVEEEEEEEHAYRVPTKQEASQIKKNLRKDLRTEQTTEQSKAQVDSMKVLTETRDLMQELVVTQLKSQARGEFSKKPQQAGISFGVEEMCSATPVSLEDTLPETVPIEQEIRKAPGTQGQA